jgi:hypothetical protein
MTHLISHASVEAPDVGGTLERSLAQTWDWEGARAATTAARAML